MGTVLHFAMEARGIPPKGTRMAGRASKELGMASSARIIK